MSMFGYWTGNFLSDVISAYVPIFFIMLLNFGFNEKTTDGYMFLLMYPLAIVPFSYYSSFIFSDDTTAQVGTLFFHFVTGGILATVSFVLQLIPTTIPYGDPIRFVGLLFPSFCVVHAFVFARDGDMLTSTRQQLIDGDYPDLNEWPTDSWDWYNLKADFYALVAHAIFGVLFLGLIESPVMDCCARMKCCEVPLPRDDLEMDEDVLEEEDRVNAQHRGQPSTFIKNADSNAVSEAEGESQAGNDTYDVIRVNNFSKTYVRGCGETVRAVQGVSFGLEYGECFALLGVNGAGKSTTFKSLTRDIVPTTGEIHIQNFDVQEQFTSARKLIGYCP